MLQQHINTTWTETLSKVSFSSLHRWMQPDILRGKYLVKGQKNKLQDVERQKKGKLHFSILFFFLAVFSNIIGSKGVIIRLPWGRRTPVMGSHRCAGWQLFRAQLSSHNGTVVVNYSLFGDIWLADESVAGLMPQLKHSFTSSADRIVNWDYKNICVRTHSPWRRCQNMDIYFGLNKWFALLFF